jgi:SAM-dependent methyltransferase
MKNFEINDMLICVNCGSSLIFLEGDYIRCGNTNCNKSQNPYQYLESKPILVDFFNSVLVEGAFHEKNGESKVKRTTSFFITKLKTSIRRKNQIAYDNVDFLIEELRKYEDPKILIVGGGEVGYGLDLLYSSFSGNIVSFDIYNSKYVDIIADAHKIPIVNGCFDLVIIQAVLEHVIDPTKVVSEIYRVLKEDGIVYAETPFMQQVHEGPYDFLRFSESGHRYLFRHFSLLKSGYLLGVGTSLLWSLSYFIGALFRSRLVAKVFRFFFFWLSYFDKIIPDSYNVDGACGVFFIGRRTAQEISPKDIIRHYKGNQRNVL